MPNNKVYKLQCFMNFSPPKDTGKNRIFCTHLGKILPQRTPIIYFPRKSGYTKVRYNAFAFLILLKAHKIMADEDENIQNEDQTEGGEGLDDDESGGDKKKLLLLLIPVILLLIGAGLYFTGMLDPLLGKKECVEEVDDHGEIINECPEEEEHHDEDGHDGDDHGKDGKGDKDGKEAKKGKASFLEIPTMIVNLNTEGGTPRYLRLRVELEFSDAKDQAAVEAVIPRVVDQFQTYLRELRVRDLRGSAGIYRLQTELLWRVNQAAAPVEVEDVLFQEILIQ